MLTWHLTVLVLMSLLLLLVVLVVVKSLRRSSKMMPKSFVRLVVLALPTLVLRCQLRLPPSSLSVTLRAWI
jgi:hypothetical protein